MNPRKKSRTLWKKRGFKCLASFPVKERCHCKTSESVTCSRNTHFKNPQSERLSSGSGSLRHDSCVGASGRCANRQTYSTKKKGTCDQRPERFDGCSKDTDGGSADTIGFILFQ